MVRPRAINDNELIQQAMLLFWRQGFASTGIRDLEQHLGLKAPGIYNRFGSKDELYRIALARYLDVVVTWRIQHYLLEQPPLHGLRRFFDTTYDYVDAEHPPLSCFLVTTSLELGAKDPLVADILRDGAQRLRTGFRQHLERAISAGLLSATLDLDAWVDVLHLNLQGILVSSKVANDQTQLKYQVDSLFRLLQAAEQPKARDRNSTANQCTEPTRHSKTRKPPRTPTPRDPT
jgi:TetR/AcrR family transcriptional repressor of nem operon